MRWLITAGPTYEPIDAVRFIGNRSSGQMGVAIASAAARFGHETTLLLGPSALPLPSGVRTQRFATAEELRQALHAAWPSADLLVMAAAVADFRPRSADLGQKLERGNRLTLELEPVPDLLAELAPLSRPDQRRVGFALEEPAKLAERATAKLARKSLDAIVANPLATMDAPGIAGYLLFADGSVASPASGPGPMAPIAKDAFAAWLVAELSRRFG